MSCRSLQPHLQVNWFASSEHLRELFATICESYLPHHLSVLKDLTRAHAFSVHLPSCLMQFAGYRWLQTIENSRYRTGNVGMTQQVSSELCQTCSLSPTPKPGSSLTRHAKWRMSHQVIRCFRHVGVRYTFGTLLRSSASILKLLASMCTPSQILWTGVSRMPRLRGFIIVSTMSVSSQ